MNNYYLYIASLLVFSIIAGICAFWIFTLSKENLPDKEKLPRSVIIGIILVFIDLLWCIPNAKPLLSASMHAYLIPAALFFTFVSYKFLDYLFARAAGGFFILLAHYFLYESYACHSPAKPLFSLFCYLVGIAGIIFAGKPYLMRDFIRKASKNKKLRLSSGAFFAAFALLSLSLGIMHLLK
jgi:hypothetical protein